MIKEILLSSILSLSTSVRTSNDDTKPLDYEYMTKIEKTEGNFTYLFKKDWERELGEKYIDNIVKFKFKSQHNVYGGMDWIEKESKDIHYTTYNVGFYSKDGWSIGIAVKEGENEIDEMANFAFSKKLKKDDLEYFISISAKSDLQDNQIFNVKSDVKKWITKNINIFGLYKHESYNENVDYQFKAGIGFKF